MGIGGMQNLEGCVMVDDMGVGSFEERDARFEIKTDRALERGWWQGEIPFFAMERSEGAE